MQNLEVEPSEADDIQVFSDASPASTLTPTTSTFGPKKRKQNDGNTGNTQAMKKHAYEGLTKALAQKNETPIHIFGQLVTSELLKLKEI